MIKVHDSVVVKPGVSDADFDTAIGGWQGRVAEIDVDNDLFLIEWDSVTLRNMLDSMIEQCEVQGFAWTKYYIAPQDVTLTSPRDTERDVIKIIDKLEKKHFWDSMGIMGRGIRKVLTGVDPGDDVAMFDTWERHIKGNLTFPFEAEVDEFQERGPLRGGDRVTVVGITSLDYSYGIIVHLKRGRRWYDFPLCDLAVLDEDSPTDAVYPHYQVVQDYRMWFANR